MQCINVQCRHSEQSLKEIRGEIIIKSHDLLFGDFTHRLLPQWLKCLVQALGFIPEGRFQMSISFTTSDFLTLGINEDGVTDKDDVSSDIFTYSEWPCKVFYCMHKVLRSGLTLVYQSLLWVVFCVTLLLPFSAKDDNTL